MNKNQRQKTFAVALDFQEMGPKFTKIKKDIGLAISGKEIDFTSVPMKRAIFLLAVPMVLEMVMESVFAVCDIYFVSRLGAEAVAAVGITENMMTIIYALCMGLSVGTSALVSRRIGEKNKKDASATALQAIYTGIFISILIAVPCAIYSRELLQLMGASDSAIAIGGRYTSIMFAGNVIIMLLFVINAIFRSAGDPVLSMIVLTLANIINVILDPCLIFGIGPFPKMGVEGAAVATNIGRGIAVVVQLAILMKGVGRIKIDLRFLKPVLNVAKQIVKLSLWSVLQLIIATSSWIVLMAIVAKFGDEVVAGYTIAIRIFIFTLLPAWGIANAATTLVGQNLGAHKPDRAEQAVYKISVINMAVILSSAIIFLIIPDVFIRIFDTNPDVVKPGAACLRYISIGSLFYASGMVLTHAFNGAGDTTTPMWINLFCFWAIEIPVAYVLAVNFGMKENGVYASIVIAESLLTTIAFIIFKKGKWKLKQV